MSEQEASSACAYLINTCWVAVGRVLPVACGRQERCAWQGRFVQWRRLNSTLSRSLGGSVCRPARTSTTAGERAAAQKLLGNYCEATSPAAGVAAPRRTDTQRLGTHPRLALLQIEFPSSPALGRGTGVPLCMRVRLQSSPFKVTLSC